AWAIGVGEFSRRLLFGQQFGPGGRMPSRRAFPSAHRRHTLVIIAPKLAPTYSGDPRQSMSKPFDLTGKAALVTGGNGGIGLGIARGLAQAGARVAIIARNLEKSRAAAKALTEETGVAPFVLTADVSVPDQVATVVNEAKKGLGRIDIL